MNIKAHAESADIGWGSLYYHVIPSIINKFNLKLIAEIGVAFGGHLEQILSKTKVEKVYGVDPYILFNTSTDNFSYQNMRYTQQDYDNLYLFTKERLKEFNERIVLFRETSVIASKKINNDYLDLVFIDAEHTFDALKTDLETWHPKIKTGGIISGHDYNHINFPDVKKFVDNWVKENNYDLNVEDGYVWWVIKK